MIITDEKALRIQCADVLPDEIGPLREQLERELEYSAKMGRIGIGLAAPQIGIAKNIAIVRVNNHTKIDLVNCKITAGYDKEIFEQEGCLSFPGRFERSLRFQEIVVEGNVVYPTRFVCTGLLAVVCQHELDHLTGKLLPDFAIPRLDKNKLKPNDKCSCGSGKKYKKCCGDK
jgi:peptide deformylase